MALNLDTNTAHDIKYKYFCITDILPNDIMQYIVSFTDKLKQIESIIDEQSFTPIVKYEEHHKTWIIHPTRTQLNSQEIEDGYKGPINLLKQLVGRVRSGDKLLFYDGNYVETEHAELNVLKKRDVQVIGMESNVNIKIYETSDDMRSHNLYLKNIKLE
eukprot:925816_1